MKNRKMILLLTVGIALLSLVNVSVFLQDKGRNGISRGITLLDPSADVTSVRIERKGALPVLIAKSSVWRMVEPFSSEVDERMVLRLIDSLSQTPVSDSISDSELLRIGRSRADFELEDPGLRIKVVSGEKSAGYLFGSVTPDRSGVYVAVEGSGSVFVMPTNMLSAVDVPVDVFRRRALFSLVPETVAGFAVKRSSGSIVGFSRSGENWKVDGSDASADKVRKFMSDVLSSSAMDFIWPVGMTNESKTASASLLSSYGLDPESAVTVTFTDVDGDTDRISFGKNSSAGAVYALVQRGGAIVTVPAGLKEQAMQDAGMFTDSRLFPFKASAVAAIAIADADVSYAFSRGKNGEWFMETPASAPADSGRVDSMLNRLLALSRADVAASGLAVSFTSNSSPVTVSRSAVLGDMRLEDLRSREILKIDPVTVRRIVMSTPDKNVKPVSVVYNRDRRAWNVEHSGSSSVVDDAGVAAVLAAINPLMAERIERLKVSAEDLSAYGLEFPRLTVAVDLDVEKSVRRNIMIGNRTGSGCYVTVGSSDAVFVISDEAVGRISASVVRSNDD